MALQQCPDFREWEDLCRFLDTGHRLVTSFSAAAGSHDPALVEIDPTEAPSGGALVADEAERILREANKPLTASEILTRLAARSIRVPGKRPRNNLSARLSYNKQRFESTPMGWRLRLPDDKEPPHPPSGGEEERPPFSE